MENTSGEREFKTKIITLTNYYLNKKGATHKGHPDLNK